MIPSYIHLQKNKNNIIYNKKQTKKVRKKGERITGGMKEGRL
jgi:hypothetical protein